MIQSLCKEVPELNKRKIWCQHDFDWRWLLITFLHQSIFSLAESLKLELDLSLYTNSPITVLHLWKLSVGSSLYLQCTDWWNLQIQRRRCVSCVVVIWNSCAAWTLPNDYHTNSKWLPKLLHYEELKHNLWKKSELQAHTIVYPITTCKKGDLWNLVICKCGW